MIGNQENQPFRLNSPAVAPISDKLRAEKYGDILYEDAKLCPGLPNYKRYADRKPDPRKYDRGPTKHYPGPWQIAGGIQLKYKKTI